LKVTDSENIRELENELIEVLTGDLDWQAIETILREKYNLRLHDDVAYNRGDIVVHKNRVAYKLNFDVKVSLSLLFGRDGECLEITASDDEEGKDAMLKDAYPVEVEDDNPPLQEKKSTIDRDTVSKIANLISDINK
jgi:hypothetical protein